MFRFFVSKLDPKEKTSAEWENFSKRNKLKPDSEILVTEFDAADADTYTVLASKFESEYFKKTLP